MKTDWRNLVIAVLACALLWSLWEHAKFHLSAPPMGLVGFQLAEPGSIDVFGGGGTVRGPDVDRPPARFYDSSVRAEGIPDDTRTGSVVALLDLMGCNTHWEFWFDRELFQECYARMDGSYMTMAVNYQWIRHLRRTFVSANDYQTGAVTTVGQALQIVKRDYEASYSASERELIEEEWKEQHPDLVRFLQDAEPAVSE